MQKSVISLDAFNLGYDYEKMKILEELARLKKENDKLRSDLNALKATSTNHNESEKKFEQLFNNISDAFYYLKIDDHGVAGEPFFTTKETGTGLGLVVTFNIIRTHHGEISVKSKWNEGTTFTVRLPVTEESC